MRRLSKTEKNILIAGAIIFLILFGVQYKLNILPGFEGMEMGVYGFQPNTYSSVYPLNDVLPGSYDWVGTATPSSAAVKWTNQAGLSDTNTIDIGNCILSNSSSSSLPPVKYSIKNPNNSSQIMHVVGYIEVYNCNVNLVLTGQIQSIFSGSTWWVNFASIVWNSQSTDPFNPSVNGYVFETPLYAVVSQVQWKNQGQNQVSIGTVGNQLAFYSSPNAAGQTLASLVQYSPSSSSNLNNTLSSIYAPDSRMQRLVYSPITLTTWTPINCFIGIAIFGCDWPNVHATIQLYTLRLGEYIYTNPSKIALNSSTVSGCTGVNCPINGIGSWLSNPFNVLGGAIFVIVLLAVLVFAAVFAFSIGFKLRRTS